MADASKSLVNEAIERALRDGAEAIERRGILVEKRLDAQTRLATEDPVLDQALYTIFRGLPDRLAPGATLLITTSDRAGGDIELIWEAREMVHPIGDKDLPLAKGPYGDLLEIAIGGLSSICRVRTGHQDHEEDPRASSSNVLQLAPHVRRRYYFLIPSLERAPDWAPARELTRS